MTEAGMRYCSASMLRWMCCAIATAKTQPIARTVEATRTHSRLSPTTAPGTKPVKAMNRRQAAGMRKV
eukprot:9138611-Lingulodinium_polyedra.AAC.1